MILAATTAAAAEPNAGWGRLLALLITGGLFWAGTTIHQRWLTMKGKPLPPAGEGVALEGVKSQVGAGSDPTMTPSREVATKADADLDGFVRGHVGKARPSQIIRAARQQFRVSETTVKRAIRRARMGGQP